MQSMINECETSPLSLIVYGQSGSGKTTIALTLLEAVIKTRSTYSMSVVQWYQDGWLRGTLRIHDMVKCIDYTGNSGIVLEDEGRIVFRGNAAERTKYDSMFHITKANANVDDRRSIESLRKVAEKKFTFGQGHIEVVEDITTVKKIPVSEIKNFSLFLQKLEKVRLTRETKLNPESSRSVTFITLYDTSGKAVFLLVDLPGNEERDYDLILRSRFDENGSATNYTQFSTWPLNLEADTFQHILPWMRELFKEKKKNAKQEINPRKIRASFHPWVQKIEFAKIVPYPKSSRYYDGYGPSTATTTIEFTNSNLQGTRAFNIKTGENAVNSDKVAYFLEPMCRANSALVLVLTNYRTLLTANTPKFLNYEDTNRLRLSTMADTFQFIQDIEATKVGLCQLPKVGGNVRSIYGSNPTTRKHHQLITRRSGPMPPRRSRRALKFTRRI